MHQCDGALLKQVFFVTGRYWKCCCNHRFPPTASGSGRHLISESFIKCWSAFFFLSLLQIWILFLFFCFSATPPRVLLSTGPTAPTFTTASPKTTSGMWVWRRSLSVAVLQHRQIVWSSLSRLVTGCVSAGCDTAELPGCPEGRCLKGQRWLRKGVKEASENTKTKGWPKHNVWLVEKCDYYFIQRSCLCPGSGPNDHVFVYFTDHGAPGILAFPNDDVSTFPARLRCLVRSARCCAGC